MGVPHIVLGLLAVFLAYDSQQNATLAAPDLLLEDGEPHHITVPILIEPVGPALPPAPPPVPPRPPSAADPPFTIGGGAPPPVSYRSSGGDTVQLAVVVVVLRPGESEPPPSQLHLDHLDQPRGTGGRNQHRAVRRLH